MKKKLAGVLVACMILCMGTTVFASGSSDTSSVTKEYAEAMDKNVAGTSTSTGVTVSNKPLETETLYVMNVEQSKIAGGEPLLATDLTVPAGTDLSKGMQIKIECASISKGDVIAIYHYLKAYNVCDRVIPDEIGDGYVVATFYSLSPIQIVKYPAGTKLVATGLDAKLYGASNQDGANGNNDPSNNESATTNGAQSTTSASSDSNSGDATTGASTATSNPTATSTPSTTSASSSDSSTGSSDSSSSANNTQKVTVNVNGGNESGNGSTGGSSSSTSPKTGSSLPALPIIAAFALMSGIVVCGKKAKSL